MKTFNEIPLAAQIERWANVERVLVGLPEHERTKHWDMGEWGRLTDCGTVACAAGHCGLDPWFRERGFTMDLAKCDCSPDCTYTNAKIVPVEEFFGVRGSGAIFKDATRRPVEKVIEEVRAYLAVLRGTRE